MDRRSRIRRNRIKRSQGNRIIKSAKTQPAAQVPGSPRRGEPTETDVSSDEQSPQKPGSTALPSPSILTPSSIAEAEAAVPVEWLPGSIILDQYYVRRELDKGAQGVVYLVHHQGRNIDMVVKSPRPEFLAKARGKERFIREAETWAKLDLYPHIVSCYYVRTLGGLPRVFTEYVAGGNLSHWIRSRRLYMGGHKQALERMLDMAIQFAWGLQYAHDQGLIHRDVKPSNVMMTSDGIVKVTDFGQGMTTLYCSPEQAEKGTLSHKTDIWSWAVSVLEMFVGSVVIPWKEGPRAGEWLVNHKQAVAQDRTIPPMPFSVAGLLEKCFQQQPEKRPATMLDVATELQAIYAHLLERPYWRQPPKPVEMLADSRNNRAISMSDLGRIEEAEQLWKQALQVDPQHLEATYNRGVVLWRRGEITDVDLVRQLELLRITQARRWRGNYLLAQVQLERGAVKAARDLLEETVFQATEKTEVKQLHKKVLSGSIVGGDGLRAFYGHTGPITSVDLSADGHLALSGSGRWFSGFTGEGGDMILSSVGTFAFSESGQRLRAGGSVLPGVAEPMVLAERGSAQQLNEGGDFTVRLWEIVNGACLRILRGHTHWVTSVSLSADKRFALSGSTDQTLRLWNIANGACLFQGSAGHVEAVTLSADGRFALSGSRDGVMRLWDVTTGKCLCTFTGHNGWVNCVSLSADRRFALSGEGNLLAGSVNSLVRLWDVANGTCLRHFQGHTAPVTSVSLSADGHLALSGSVDKTVRLWEVASGRCLRLFQGHIEPVRSVSLSTDGNWVFSGGNAGMLCLWEISTGRCLRTFGGHRGMNARSVSLLPDTHQALSGGDDGTLNLWQLPRGNLGICSLSPSKEWSYSNLVQVEDQGQEIFKRAEEAIKKGDIPAALRLTKEARRLPGWERLPQRMHLWAKLANFCQKTSLRTAWLAKTIDVGSKVEAVSLSADGRFALSGSQESHAVQLWDVANGTCLQSFEGHTDSVISVSLSPDGRFALSGSSDETMRSWNVATGQCLRIFKGHTGHVSSVSLSVDGRLVASAGSWDNTVRLWNVATGECLRSFVGHSGNVISVSLSSDQRFILSGSADRTMRLWEVSTGHCLRVFYGHSGWVTPVSLSFDGRRALSGSFNGMMRLWDTSTGQCIHTLQGYSSYLSSVVLSADGRWSLTGSYDGTARFWQAGTDHCIHIFEGHQGWVSSVNLSADEHWVLSGSYDGTLRLWELDWELEARNWANWDEGARPFLEIFLTMHSTGKSPWGHWNKPQWSKEDFQQLLSLLGHSGYGWLRPDGVLSKLEQMARKWQGQQPLTGTL